MAEAGLKPQALASVQGCSPHGGSWQQSYEQVVPGPFLWGGCAQRGRTHADAKQPSLSNEARCLLILRHASHQDGRVMGWGNDSCRVWFDVIAGPLTDSPVLSASLQQCVSYLVKAGLP